MKFIMKMQKNWNTVALSALTLMSTSLFSVSTEDGKSAAAICKAKAVFIMGQEQLMTQFFNSSNTTPYNDIYIAMVNKKAEFINKLALITTSGKLSQKAHAIAQETCTYFGAAIGIIQQYNGKPATEAPKFVSDMNKVFSAEQAFASITTKLMELLNEAQAEGETELVTVIKQLLTVLQKKKTEWSKKKDLSLLTGLTVRMCK